MDEHTKNDVLFGRGRGIYNHEGNVTFRKLIKKHNVIYHFHQISSLSFIKS